jgi:type VI secretion system protein ImpL
MKETLSKFLKIFLVVLAVLLVVLLVFGIVLALNWPWWVGIFLLLILMGLGVGFLFFRKLWLRRKEQQFVQQVIEQDESQIKKLSGKEKDDLKELQDRWKEAVEALRRSHLRKQGNPLYVLPWYMVIGESGSGKTTSITSARLSSPFAEINRTSGISGTRNCDWWFFEQAIILDTAGRYAIPVDEGRDKEEWQRFMSLLIKYRKKEPIHGVIVTLSSDKIIQAGPEALEEDGKNIRHRIDELMRVLGVKFPVYVLVTKCDLVQGMTQFCDQLPEKALDQPMGVINQQLSTDVTAFLDRALGTLGERLRNLRILLLHQPGPKGIEPGLLLFPEEFENLKKGLESFTRGAFRENPYQETPILRGLFFSSGRQEGSPYSHFLQALGLIGEKEVLPGTNKGLFLHDFFAKILPRERGLFAPTRRALEWSALTRNLGLTAWVILMIALCGLLSFSFVKNLRTIREVSHEFTKGPLLKGETLIDLGTMDRFRQTILKVEDQNRNWWIPRFGLDESVKVETGLKNKYCTQFQNGFLAPFDKEMAGVMASLTVTTPEEITSQYIVHLVRRINILKARLDGQGLQPLQAKPQPSYVSSAAGAQSLNPEVRKKFGSLYLYYLIWRQDPGETNKEISILRSWLKHLLTLKGSNLQWLIVWVEKQGGLAPVMLRDFWGGSLAVSGEKAISPAFTRKGKEMIDSFVKEIEIALPEAQTLADPKGEFEKRYRSICSDVWYQFGAQFPKGVESLKDMKEWQQLAAKMSTDQGPYIALLNRMALELEPLARTEGLPPWLQEVFRFQAARAQGALAGSKGALAKAAEGGKKLIGTIEKTFGRETGEDTVESQLMAAKAYQEYQGALAAIGSASTSRSQAFQAASQTFSEDAATAKSPFFAAYGAAGRLRTSIGKGRVADEVFSKLITGPVDFLWRYVRMEAACYLQRQWEEKVLAESEGASGQQAIQLLLGPEGLAWKFVKGTAAPFIGRSPQKGYYSRDVMGGTIPFDSSFFTFLVKGAQAQAAAVTKQNYTVGIKGLPTDANPEARIKPHSTKLELHCTTGIQNLVNLNFPVSRTFIWSAETCKDVLFQIEVGDVVLTKKYTGDQAFPEFLQDFKGGQHTFYPNEFPGEKGVLEKLGIRYIKANYQFTGDQPVLGQVKSLPGQAPRSIVKCWAE